MEEKLWLRIEQEAELLLLLQEELFSLGYEIGHVSEGRAGLPSLSQLQKAQGKAHLGTASW